MAKTAKIEKVIDEISKTKIQISELQSRLKQLEQQRTEIENSDIVGTVRSYNISIKELEEMIKLFKANKAVKINKEQEVLENES